MLPLLLSYVHLHHTGGSLKCDRISAAHDIYKHNSWGYGITIIVVEMNTATRGCLRKSWETN